MNKFMYIKSKKGNCHLKSVLQIFCTLFLRSPLLTLTSSVSLRIDFIKKIAPFTVTFFSYNA